MMLKTRPLPILAWALAASAALCLLNASAAAQSESDLRRANEALRNELRDAQLRLDAANKRIRELEAQVAQLREALAAGGGAPAPLPDLPPEEVSIDESVPNASPRALFNALVASYAGATKDLELGTDRPDDKQRIAYARAVDSWVKAANRQFKDKITWHVRIDETMRDPNTGQHLVRLVAVDPKTDVVLGEPFVVRIDRPTAMRLQRMERYADLSVLILSGVMEPQARYNPDRQAPGPFEKDLIGPFAEFGFSVEVTSLVPPEKEKPAEGAKPAAEKSSATSVGAEKP